MQTLQKSGAKVVVANLVDVLGAPFFFPGPTLPQSLAALLESAGVPPPVAAIVAANYAQQINQLYGIGPKGGYLTLQGVGKVATAIQSQLPPTGLVPAGDYVTAALAVKLKKANLAYNAAIANVSKVNGAPLVDIYSFFVGIERNGLPVNPPVCCNLQYGGGFSSLDGLHPSNTGYAEIANLFIDTIDHAYGYSIPEVNVQAIYATDPYAPH